MRNIFPNSSNPDVAFPIQAKRFKELRNSYHISQESICDLIKRDLKTYRKWEKGYERPDCEILIQLAKLYGVATDYLLGLIDEKNHDLKFVCEYTGLSEESVLVLRNMTKWNSESDSWNNDIDYFLSLCGEDFAFYLSELRYNRMQAVINQKSGSSFTEKSNNLKLKNKLNFTLYSFLQYCSSIPEKLFDLQHVISDLEKQK